jgi:hypothetical protein
MVPPPRGACVFATMCSSTAADCASIRVNLSQTTRESERRHHLKTSSGQDNQAPDQWPYSRRRGIWLWLLTRVWSAAIRCLIANRWPMAPPVVGPSKSFFSRHFESNLRRRALVWRADATRISVASVGAKLAPSWEQLCDIGDLEPMTPLGIAPNCWLRLGSNFFATTFLSEERSVADVDGPRVQLAKYVSNGDVLAVGRSVGCAE